MKKSTMKENMRIIAKGMPILMRKLWFKVRKPLCAVGAMICFFLVLVFTAGVENSNADLGSYAVKSLILMTLMVVTGLASGYWKE